jgi:hypothetical protein
VAVVEQGVEPRIADVVGLAHPDLGPEGAGIGSRARMLMDGEEEDEGADEVRMAAPRLKQDLAGAVPVALGDPAPGGAEESEGVVGLAGEDLGIDGRRLGGAVDLEEDVAEADAGGKVRGIESDDLPPEGERILQTAVSGGEVREKVGPERIPGFEGDRAGVLAGRCGTWARATWRRW